MQSFSAVGAEESAKNLQTQYQYENDRIITYYPISIFVGRACGRGEGKLESLEWARSLMKARGAKWLVEAFALMPAGMKHFGWATGETVLQIHGKGPFEIKYVNPADDPRNAKK